MQWMTLLTLSAPPMPAMMSRAVTRTLVGWCWASARRGGLGRGEGGHAVAGRDRPRGQLQGDALGRGVGDGHDRRRVLARLADLLQVHRPERLAGAHALSGGDGQREGAALELDGVDAQVEEDLQAVVGRDAHGVTGAGDHGDGPADGGDDVAGAGAHAEALSEGAGGEDRIGDGGEGDGLARGRGDQCLGG